MLKRRCEEKATAKQAVLVDNTNRADMDQEKGKENEEIDIDLNDPEVAAVTAKLQKGFRSKLALRKKIDRCKSLDTEMQTKEKKENEAAIKIQASFKGAKTRKEVKEKKEREDQAATKIQASFRGSKTRSSLKKMKDDEGKIQAGLQGVLVL